MRLGYACINNALAENDICVNRSIIKKTFLQKGIGYASEIALKNIADFAKVIDWNIKHRIDFYRMSSDMFPWMSEYELEQLPDISKIKTILARIGEKAKEHNLRLTFHPGPFNVLASPNDTVVDKTLKELRQHGEIMDMIQLPRSPFAKINIHIGGAYGDKTASLERFVTNYRRLADTARLRLTVENDDKANMFSVRELLSVHERTGIPIVFDFLHHKFCMGDLTEEEALEIALDTWGDITPVVHFSSSKRKFEDKASLETAHADFIYEPVKKYGRHFDIMLEAKAKEAALEKYRNTFVSKRVQDSIAMPMSPR